MVWTPELLDLGLLAPSGRRRNPEAIAREIEHADARDARRRVQGELDAPVALERGLRDLDQEEHIAGGGMRPSVEIGAGPHDRQVRLQLTRPQDDRLLLANLSATAEARA